MHWFNTSATEMLHSLATIQTSVVFLQALATCCYQATEVNRELGTPENCS